MVYQIAYFATCAAFLSLVGYLFVIPPLKKGQFDKILARFLFSVGVKLIVGALILVVALRTFEWPTTVSAIGTVSAYFFAVIVTTITALFMIRREDR